MLSGEIEEVQLSEEFQMKTLLILVALCGMTGCGIMLPVYNCTITNGPDGQVYWSPDGKRCGGIEDEHDGQFLAWDELSVHDYVPTMDAAKKLLTKHCRLTGVSK